MKAYAALQRLKSGDRSPEAKAEFDRLKDDLGYGLLLKKYTANVVDATPEQIAAAVNDTIPNVAPIFWSFRFMVGIGLWLLFVFSAAFIILARRQLARNRWIMKVAMWSIPLPWIAMELGWIVAEYGRQPWTISEVLPTHSVGVVGFAGTGDGSASAASLSSTRRCSSSRSTCCRNTSAWVLSSLGTGRYQDEGAKS
jgi:cytochrome d ubiquinol oxidase subunit I